MQIEFIYSDIPPIEIRDTNLIGVYGPNHYASNENEKAVIKKGLSNPIGTKPLNDLVTNSTRILILVDDYTRTTPAWKILPYVLRELRSAGFKYKDISVLIAQGTHRKMSLEEKEKKIGTSILSKITVHDHEWNNEKSLQYIGDSSSGIPIWINKLLKEFDFIMGLGHIVPHNEAGFSGGGKIILPGVCGKKTTEGTHWLSPAYSVSDLMGKIDNPIRKEIDEIANRVGLRFIINVVEDNQGKIAGLFCGHPVLAFRQGCELSLKIYGVSIPQKADIVIIDSYPCDTEFWIASKAIFAADIAVRKGGIIILVTPCEEGISSEHPEILKYRFMPFSDLQRLIKQGKLLNDVIGGAFLALVGNIIVKKARCILVSKGIPFKIAEKLGFITAATPQEGLRKAYELIGEKSKVIVFRRGSEIMPIV